MASDSIPEEWRAIEGWPYEVSDLGRVRRASAEFGRTRSGKILRPQRQGQSGHLKVFFCKDGKVKEMRLHRLVCEAWHGPAPSPKHQAAHIDGDPGNNLPENLYWALPIENCADTIRHGRTNRGERCNLAKITDRDARMALTLAARGISVDVIAQSFRVSERLIRRVLDGETFRHISKSAA